MLPALTYFLVFFYIVEKNGYSKAHKIKDNNPMCRSSPLTKMLQSKSEMAFHVTTYQNVHLLVLTLANFGESKLSNESSDFKRSYTGQDGEHL